MKLKNLISHSLFGVATVTSLSFLGCREEMPTELPNILWLTSKDNSPLLGCYGDKFATTPNLDKLASEGFLYTYAYAKLIWDAGNMKVSNLPEANRYLKEDYRSEWNF